MLCIGYLFIVLSGAPVKNKIDLRVEKSAAKTCRVKYGSCLSKLERVEKQHYRAHCR